MNTDSGFAMACFPLIQVDVTWAVTIHTARPTRRGHHLNWGKPPHRAQVKATLSA
jgi:hypothetical protein